MPQNPIHLFDPKCFELAEYFLPASATEAMKNSLAHEIQCAVEDWLDEEAEVNPSVKE